MRVPSPRLRAEKFAISRQPANGQADIGGTAVSNCPLRLGRLGTVRLYREEPRRGKRHDRQEPRERPLPERAIIGMHGMLMGTMSAKIWPRAEAQVQG